MKLQNVWTACAAAAVLFTTVAAVPVYAADSTQQTQFSYVQTNEPTYTVSIPSSLALTKEGAPLDITASDVAYLDGKKVSAKVREDLKLEVDNYNNDLAKIKGAIESVSQKIIN